ncbi:MAG: hypothetical protein ACRDZ9_05980 [Acidimicrobiales bacterium]
MAFEVTTVAYGRPAVDALVAAVATAKGGDPLAPVTVVVPSNYAAVAGRRALAAIGPGVAAVSFVTLHRLAERLGGPRLAAAGRRPVSAPVIAQAVRLVLAEAPGMFAPVADHPATEQALVAAHRELAAVSEPHLEAVAEASARAAEVVRIHRRISDLLGPAWHDEHDLLGAATAAVQTAPPTGSVIVHLAQSLTSAGAAFLRALAADGTVRVIVGLTGEVPADEGLRRALGRAGIDLGDEGGPTPATAHRVLSVSDPDEEVRSVVRHVVAAARAGVPLGRVAVVYGAADPYVRLLHEHLAAAGIPHNGAPVRTVGQGLVGRTLRALLALPDRRFRRGDVLALLSSRLLDRDGRWLPARAWERVSRAAGVVEGDDWRERLHTFATAQRGRAEEAEAEERPSTASRYRREADQADGLAGFVARLRDDLAKGRTAGGWAATVDWAHGLLARYLGGHDRREGWPEDERRAGERVEAALDGLAGLDAIGGPAPTRRCSGARSTASSRPPWPGSAGSATGCSWATCPSPRACAPTGSSCSAWPRGPSPAGGWRTRCCPTASAPSPAASWSCEPTASRATATGCWRRWPAPRRRRCASPGATCAAPATAPPHAGCSPTPPGWAGAATSTPRNCAPSSGSPGSRRCRRSPRA